MTAARSDRPELVVHLYTALDDADGYAELTRIYQRCRTVLGLTQRFSRSGIDFDPPSWSDEPRPSRGRQLHLAAAKHPHGQHQAIVRQVEGFVNFSAVLTRPSGGWERLADQWSTIVGSEPAELLGGVRLFLDYDPAPTTAEAAQRVSGRIPFAGTGRWWRDGGVAAPGIGIWEPAMRTDPGRAQRDVIVLAAPGDHDALSTLTWSDATADIPPLGRYLLYAATIRHHIRVLRVADDRSSRQIESLTAMRDNVRRAQSNMDAVLDRAAGGPIADDTEAAGWLITEVNDELADARTATIQTKPNEEIRMSDNRRVFVIHGRDEQVRQAMFAFLQSLDLRPLDWEEVVPGTGAGTPFLGDVLTAAFDAAQAAIVVLTPDDGTILHPSLRGSQEEPYESVLTGQARPNVLFEAGLAMARFPQRTLIVEVGHLRPFADIGGRNVIRFDGRVESLNKIVQRLRVAGCTPNTSGNGWLDTHRFAGLEAYTRRFDNL